MILTVTPNPLLERRLTFNSVSLGVVNRSTEEIFYPGGKGINVSRQLSKLGIKNLALTFLGGNNGKLLRKAMESDGINFNAVSTKSETRDGLLSIDEEKMEITSFISPDSEITEKEIDEFISRMDKAIQNCSIVLLSGSAPTEYSKNIFTEGVKLANKYDKITFIDTYGDHLKDCIELSPFALHNNQYEIETSFGLELKSEEEKVNFLNLLNQHDVKMGFITDGENEIYSSKFGFNFKTKPPKVNGINSLGSGDAFVAGIMYGIEKAFVYNDFVKLGTALGALNAERLDAANIDYSEAETLLKKIEVIPIGKKMKLIDDSPNY